MYSFDCLETVDNCSDSGNGKVGTTNTHRELTFRAMLWVAASIEQHETAFRLRYIDFTAEPVIAHITMGTLVD